MDNTFLTPYLQRPLAMGADIVVHSVTKYLAGHHDLVAGAIVAKDAAVGEQLFADLAQALVSAVAAAAAD